jgi:hypothetical protein
VIILSEIIFLVIVLPKIVAVGMTVALFFFMLIPVHLGMGLSEILSSNFAFCCVKASIWASNAAMRSWSPSPKGGNDGGCGLF